MATYLEVHENLAHVSSPKLETPSSFGGASSGGFHLADHKVARFYMTSIGAIRA